MRSALDRVPPGVLIATGLAAVVIVFGALGLAMLPGDDRSLDDLGLGAPPARAADGDGDGVSGGTGGSGASGNGGDALADGLTTRDAESDGADGSGGRDDPGAAAPPGGGSSGGGSSGAVTEVETMAPATGSTTTAPRAPDTTTPSTTATTAAPTTSTTEPAPPSPGLVGGLLDVLGLS
jgi:hypothetical protein